MAAAFVDEGLRVSVVTISSPDEDFYELAPGVQRVALNARSASGSVPRAILANARRIVELRRALRRLRPRAVLSFIGATNVLTVLATLGLPARVVVSERNDPARQPVGRVWRPLTWVVYRFADVVTANSEGVLERLEDHVPSGKLRFLPNPVPEAVQVVSDERKPLILSVGRLSHQKGFDVLLAGVAHVRGRLSGWRVVIVGDGPLANELRARADRLGVSDMVDWVGRVKDVSPYYRSAAVFVLASRFEGTPNVLLEAMAHGLPPIVTDASPGPLAYVEDGVTGLVVSTDDAEALGEAICNLVAGPQRRADLGAAARERIQMDGGDVALMAWCEVLGVGRSRGGKT